MTAASGDSSAEPEEPLILPPIRTPLPDGVGGIGGGVVEEATSSLISLVELAREL